VKERLLLDGVRIRRADLMIVERIKPRCDILANAAPSKLAIVNDASPIAEPAPDLPGVCRIPKDRLSEIFRIGRHDTVPCFLSMSNTGRLQIAGGSDSDNEFIIFCGGCQGSNCLGGRGAGESIGYFREWGQGLVRIGKEIVLHSEEFIQLPTNRTRRCSSRSMMPDCMQGRFQAQILRVFRWCRND